MRIVVTTSLMLFVSLASCKSEYDERMEEALELKKKILLVKQSNMATTRNYLAAEIEALNEKIHFLAKVSGNEELFLAEVFKD